MYGEDVMESSGRGDGTTSVRTYVFPAVPLLAEEIAASGCPSLTFAKYSFRNPLNPLDSFISAHGVAICKGSQGI